MELSLLWLLNPLLCKVLRKMGGCVWKLNYIVSDSVYSYLKVVVWIPIVKISICEWRSGIIVVNSLVASDVDLGKHGSYLLLILTFGEIC